MNNKNKNFKSLAIRKIITAAFRTWGLDMLSLVAGAINIMYSKYTVNCGKLRSVDMVCLRDLLLLACQVSWSVLDGVNGDG